MPTNGKSVVLSVTCISVSVFFFFLYLVLYTAGTYSGSGQYKGFFNGNNFK